MWDIKGDVSFVENTLALYYLNHVGYKAGAVIIMSEVKRKSSII